MPPASATKCLATGEYLACVGALPLWGLCFRQAKLECCHVWPVRGHPLSTLTQFLCLPYPEEWSKL